MSELARLLAVPLGVVVVFLALVFLLQRRLIYFPLSSAPPDPRLLPPGASALQVRTADGLELGAWWIPAREDGPGTTFLVLNGNAGDRSMRLPLAEALSAAGYSVLLVDYRGFGGNRGRPGERALLSDARAFRRHLVEELGVDPARLVLYGESLGSAVAVALAAEHPPAALVLRSPFPSLAEVGRTHYPWLPVRLLLRDRFDSIGRIGSSARPLLVIVGERDSIVPARLSRRLYDAAPDPKEWVSVPGADHNDWALLAGERLVDALAAFLGRHGLGVGEPR